MSINRYVWGVANSFQASALIPSRLRSFILRSLGCDIHPDAKIACDVFVGSSNIRMRSGSFVNTGAFLDGSALVDIGEGARIGPYVRILTGSHTYASNEMRRGPGSIDTNKAVTIERGCWVGMASLIMPGVTVARGCVIGAGSVVTSSTEPNGLYLGSPARRVKDLPVD